MKKIKQSVMAVVLTIMSIFTITPERQYHVEAAESENSVVYSIEDIRSLQNFLLGKETPDLSGKDYDLYKDGVWNVFDLCLMKRAYLNTRNFPADKSHITAQADVPMLTLNNGVQMPQLGLGTQIQRLENDSSPSGRELLNETSRQAVVSALQSGYRHLDTAHGYYNERGVGQGIIDSGVPREEIWLTSKLWPSEFGEGTTMEAIDAMLERLQTDYIDLLYLHHPVGDFVGAWKDLEKAYKQGKVRALGISNFDNWPEAFYSIVDDMEIKPQVLQIECHPFAQRLETRALAEKYNIQIECWYPLGHADDRLLNDDILSSIAEAHDKSVVQITLRWHMQEGFSAVPGSTNPAHIQENIEIFDFELTDEEMEQIRAIDKGESGRYFNIPYQYMPGFFPLVE
ncbi:MAG: aldo/keto reductase [Clostridium sp.]|nr:aldo/keto reductase [Clostridium sp.]